ncbi:MAG: DUF4446 family protein [Armatimonadetes bacterium]|nr:DUF4446 family protein [Armatimonadota bacterium]MBS1700406.1 DUF4446 family protein [Armatimonadota bacterium]MBS1725332.1 DUF4446 family protein [Armatimonadota bacterium]
MADIATSLSHLAGWLLLFLLVVVGVITIILVNFWLVLNRTRRKFSDLLNANSSQNVEQMLLDHMRERQELRNKTEQLEERITTLERKLQKSKRHVGLTKYDAFPDIGGNQSFTLAVYDDNGDGAILTSIVGRVDNKVYGKHLSNGKTGHPLTDEEQEAIMDAVRTHAKGSDSA